MSTTQTNCYCHSGKPFSECFEAFLKVTARAPSPEALMRSRFSAFCTQNIDYIERTTDPKKLATFNREGTEEWATGSIFTKLEIIKSSQMGTDGVVEFKAYFQTKADKVDHVHHEVSMFKKNGGIWHFRSGRVLE